MSSRPDDSARPLRLLPGNFSHYLWHLMEAGIIDAEPPQSNHGPKKTSLAVDRIVSTVWDLPELRESAIRPKVALIDNGCSTRHPNLPVVANADADAANGAILPPLDLGSHPFGARYKDPIADARTAGEPGDHQETPRDHFGLEDLERDLDAAFEDGLGKRLWTTFSRHGREDENATSMTGVVRRGLGAYTEEHCFHGTMCAGLIGGRPAARIERHPGALPYFGADPRCCIMPIDTSFRPSLRELILAIIYAWRRNVDVICMPRSVFDPTLRNLANARSRLADDDATAVPLGGTNRINEDEELVADFELLKALLLRVSRDIPIVLAAGNRALPAVEPLADLAYGNDTSNGIISVGAVNGSSAKSLYSSGAGDRDSPDDATLYAPSDDSARLTRRRYRTETPETVPTFSSWGVLSTSNDIGSLHGRDEHGPFWPVRKHAADLDGANGDAPALVPSGGAYALFGGTSAACAITAGVASLLVRALGGCLTQERGILIKHILCDTSIAIANGDKQIRKLDAKAAIEAAIQLSAQNGQGEDGGSNS